MTLSNFGVEYHYDSPLQVLVHAFDGRNMVLAFIDRAAVDDAFPNRPLSKAARKWLVDRNLGVIGELIAAKYDRGEVTTYRGMAGQTFPRVDIETDDLAAVRERLSYTRVPHVVVAEAL